MSKIIPVVTGTGVGDTVLGAFDAALYAAGIANYNLIKLSSIIPTGFEPKIKKVDLNNKEYGYRLYVVLASETQSQAGLQAWSGLGWVVSKTNSKKGLFVEHHGHDKKEIINLIKGSLGTMVTYRRDKFGPIKYKVVGVKCTGRPVCALVAAVYKAEDWE